MTQPFLIRPMSPTDLSQVSGIFRNSIDVLTRDHYSEKQRTAWAASADDELSFARHLRANTTLVASSCCVVVGFASLAGSNHIDMLYVDPGATRKGVASMLVETVEAIARARGASQFTVDVSDAALAFFTKRGYDAIERQNLERRSVALSNTKMAKPAYEMVFSGGAA